MTWKPPEETDSAIWAWMDKQGWPVTDTHYDSTHLIYAWEHEGAEGQCYRLWITRTAIEDVKPPNLLVENLNRLNVAEKIRQRPAAYTRVQMGSPKEVVVEQLPGPPS